jgi:hypothetical protein
MVKEGEVRRDKLAEGSIGYIEAHSNNLHTSGQDVILMSSAYQQGNGWSITPDNFHQSLQVFAIRKLPKKRWSNNQDQFDAPLIEHPAYPQFALDAVIFALFEGKNVTSSLANIHYKDKVYDIKNEFFWLTLAELQAGNPSLRLANAMRGEQDRFVAKWLQGKVFSPDAQRVLDLGKKLVIDSLPYRDAALAKFQLDRWDAGWYQIRMAFGRDAHMELPPAYKQLQAEHKAAFTALADRLRPLVYELDCLEPETWYAEQYAAVPDPADTGDNEDAHVMGADV